jgi:hypothetical protein
MDTRELKVLADHLGKAGRSTPLRAIGNQNLHHYHLTRSLLDQ